MKKSMLALSLIALGLSAFAGEKIAEYTLPNVKAELVESTAWPGKYMINAEGLLQPSEPLGSPMLPYKTLSFAVPNGYSFKEVKVEADWEVLSEKIKILPIQKPVPVSENPERPEYVESTVEATYPEAIAQARPMKITGLDVIVVSVTPFKYCEKTGLLEKAKNLKLSVIFTEKPRLMSSFSASPSSSTPLVHPDYLAATLSTLVNPEDAAPKAEQLMAAAAGTQVDYLMISPPDLYETWEWYIGERKKNHPTLTFEIVNTYNIYNTYPFKGWVKDGVETTDGTYANAAESIHAFLTAYSSEHALKYVVLGGAWLDVNDKDADGKLNRHYLQDGTEITYANAVPGVVIRVQYHPPSDLFYACVERYKDNPGHPWDPDGDELYVEPDELQHVNLQAKFAVSRMTMKPFTYKGETLSQHEVIENFVKKVNRAEDPKFVGNFKMGLASAPLNYTQRNLTDTQIVLREEEEFFDNVPNMYDPAHSWFFSDVGPVTRRHAKEIMAPYHPIIDAIGFHEPDTVSHNSSKQWAFNDFYRYDRETGSNNGHGSGTSAALFSANKFITEPGLTKINVVGISCNTGHPDLFSNKNGKSVADVSLGEAGCANITGTGGFIASMNNTRVGLSYFETRRLDGAGISERMHYNMCINVAKGMTAGEAWLGAVTKYLEDSRPKNDPNNINPAQGGTYCMAEEMLYGDPLIKIVDIYDYTWNGGNPGVWDMTTQNWTKDGEATEFYHAKNINFNVSGDTSITLNPNTIPLELNRTTLPYGGMTMNINQGDGDTFSLGGTGSLRLMNNLNVSGGTLEIGVSGGVGGVDKTENERGEVSVTSTGGIIFENTGKLVLNNNNSGSKYYFINGVKNVSEIAFNGGGAILELGGLDSTLETLSFEGVSSAVSAGNVLRTNMNKAKGELVRFLPLSLKNIALTLETYEAFFGYTGETIATLEDATLSFRQNRWRGAKDNKGNNYAERVDKKLVMKDSALAVDATEDFYLDNATIEMSGNCRFVTMNEGKFNLIGTTTVHLAEGAVCRLDADFKAGTDGKLVFTGPGRVIVGLADGPAGAIRVEGGATLEMELFMFTRLSRLELADGTTIVLPYKESNFFQVIPITGEMVVEGELVIKVKDENAEEGEIIAEHTSTGSIFQFGSLLEWASENDEWTLDKEVKPWLKNGVAAAFDLAENMYFPDIEGGQAIVRLAMSLENPFVCFANKTTHYNFIPAEGAKDVTLTFDSLNIGGWTHFAFPLTFEKRLDVAGGDAEGTEIVSPVVKVAAGGVLEAITIRGKGDSPSEVTIVDGGKFTLQGSHRMKLVLEPGAYLKAENKKYLDWNIATEIVWPEDGSKVKIDVSGFTPPEKPQVIIRGDGRHWTMQDLRKLEVEGNTCSLAVQEGTLCLVKRDDIDSPYAMTVNATALNWDDAAWLGGGSAFPKKWSESFLDWTAAGVVTVTQDNAELTLSTSAHFDTLTFVPADDTIKNFTFTIAEGGELKAREVHFEGFGGVVNVNNLELEEGELYPSTEMHIKGASSGILRSGGNDTIYIYEPSEKWVLGEGAQGFLHLAITDRVKAVRQKVLVIGEESAWPIGGLEVALFQPNPIDRAEDFFIARDGAYVYIVPPEVHAIATSGTTNWTALQWYAYDGSEATISDWNDVYAARLESQSNDAIVLMDACATAQLTIGPASGTSPTSVMLKAVEGSPVILPIQITMNAPATVKGDLLPTFDYVRGAGKLTLDTGATTTLTLSSNFSPIEDGLVELKAGSKIVLHHTIYYSTTTANWSGLTGDGEVEIVQDGNFRFTIPVPSKMFASTLSLNLQSELAYQLNAGNYTMNVSNLSGAGTVGYGVSVNDFIAMLTKDVSVAKTYSGTRTLRTTQTRVSEWKGVFSSWVGLTYFGWVLDTKLVVSGSESAPSINRRLIYSGTSNTSSGENSGSNHTLAIESSGCLELNGFWNGTINNNGLLIFGRNARVNNDSSLAGFGYITTDGDVIDLVARPALATKYKLYSGTEGTIKFNVASFATKTTVIPVQSGFTLGAKPLMMLAVDANGDMRWKEVALSDIENGYLVWKTSGAEIGPLTLTLAAGENDFDTLAERFHASGVSEIIFNGAAGGDSSVAIGNQLRTYTGALTLKGGATVTGLSPLMGSLTTNPSGKLVFTLQDITTTQDLVKVPNDFAYAADNFSIEVVGPNGETNPMGTWTKSGEKLIYKIVDINAVTTGFKFDGNATSWGTNPIGTITTYPDSSYALTRDGYGINTLQNPYGSNLYLGDTNDWSFVWCVRLSPTENGAHFSLGTKSGGGLALTTVDANHAALSRWKGGTPAEKLFTVEVPSATSRFYSYAVTYRAGRYTFYADGEEVGSCLELDGATAIASKVNWQLFSIHGGNVNNVATSSGGVIDDVRAYDVALPPAAIKALADEFPPWPDMIATIAGEVVERNVNDFYVDGQIGNICISGDGALRLVGVGEARLCQIDNQSRLVIADGVTVRVTISNGNPNPLDGHEVVVEHGGRLVFEHADNVTELANCDLSNITGEGTVEFLATVADRYIYPPTNSFAETLSFCNNTTIYLGPYWNSSRPFKVTNLSGSGTFRYDTPKTAGRRYMEVTQTESTVFAGVITDGPDNVGGGYTVTVKSDGETATDKKSLTLSLLTDASGLDKVIVDSTGCLLVKKNASLGAAEITNNGLLVFSPQPNEDIRLNAFTFNNNSTIHSTIALSGNGTLFIPLNSKHFLAPSPVGVIDVLGSEGKTGVLSLIRVEDDFKFLKNVFRVSGALEGKELAVSGGWLCAAANAVPGGTAWSTESGEWTASGFNNGTGTTSGSAVSFEDAVSTQSGGLVDAVAITVNETVSALQMNFNSTLTSYTFTGSGSIDSAKFSFIDGGAPVVLNGVTLTQSSIELVVPTSVAVGTRLITWSTPYENTFTSASLNAAGLTLEKRDNGLYAVEQPVDLDTMLFHFNDVGQEYVVTGLGAHNYTPPITIACSVKAPSAPNTVLWFETLSMGTSTLKIGLITGDTKNKIKFFYDYMSNPRTYPCGEIVVPFASFQTHTYIITFDNTVKVWKLYADGVEQGVSVEKEMAFFYNDARESYTYTHTVDGNATIDDWRLYTRVLNASEIKKYKELFPRTPALRPPKVLFR